MEEEWIQGVCAKTRASSPTSWSRRRASTSPRTTSAKPAPPRCAASARRIITASRARRRDHRAPRGGAQGVRHRHGRGAVQGGEARRGVLHVLRRLRRAQGVLHHPARRRGTCSTRWSATSRRDDGAQRRARPAAAPAAARWSGGQGAERRGLKIEGVEQRPFKAIGQALEVIPRTLAQPRRQRDPLTKLRAARRGDGRALATGRRARSAWTGTRARSWT